MSDEPVLQLQDVSKRFGRRLVLDRLNITVKPGDVYGFLGPNGAGKTTSIRIATGLLRATSGEARLFGLNARRPVARTRLGAVVEIPSFYPNLPGIENLRLIARLGGIRAEEPVVEALRAVELENAARQRVGTYSQGMRQRLGLAQALLGWPDLVILDEPTNGLDPRGVREIRRIILEVNRDRGTTFFISSHLLYEVELLCNHLTIIDEGRLVEEGATGDILRPEPDFYRMGVDDPAVARGILEKSGFGVETDTDETGLLRVRTKERDVADANALLVGQGIRVIEITPVRPTLEEYFLRRTGQGGDRGK
jgi:ABC-type multidrug transport system ATPase subunit